MNDSATLSRLFAGIEYDLEQVDHTFQERATSGLDILNSASMHALGSPGKRLRTALTLLSGKLNTYRFDKLLPLSVAFEMVHLATLIHDDIVDNAMTRRGNPTVNSLWGNNIAILLGDYNPGNPSSTTNYDGLINAPAETAVSVPFILWSAGNDGLFGTTSTTPTASELQKCDDVTTSTESSRNGSWFASATTRIARERSRW